MTDAPSIHLDISTATKVKHGAPKILATTFWAKSVSTRCDSFGIMHLVRGYESRYYGGGDGCAGVRGWSNLFVLNVNKDQELTGVATYGVCGC
jgi:hypothetical protein